MVQAVPACTITFTEEDAEEWFFMIEAGGGPPASIAFAEIDRKLVLASPEVQRCPYHPQQQSRS